MSKLILFDRFAKMIQIRRKVSSNTNKVDSNDETGFDQPLSKVFHLNECVMLQAIARKSLKRCLYKICELTGPSKLKTKL